MKNLFIPLAILLTATTLSAKNTDALNISELSLYKGDSDMTVNMRIDPRNFHLKGNQIVEITPLLSSAGDTLRLPSVRVAGRQAWIVERRENSDSPVPLLRAGKEDAFTYSSTLALAREFEEGTLSIRMDTTDVCYCRPAIGSTVPVAIIDYRPVRPALEFRYVAPTDSAEKIFNLSGKANIIFKVNRTEIDWTYAGNYAELDTILRTINAVRDNPDASVQAIYLTGYASPEGSYANNVRLAKGRTEAVKDYVVANSTFPASIYHTSYVPEDWAGLREWLVNSSMPEKDRMIAFIDDPAISEEKRNDIFRERFPEQYPWLLANVYPSLRHTDYRITYSIRKYYDVNEIREVMLKNPRNLSVNELFLYANSVEPGSSEYDEAFALAARLYPENKIANLNAANSAMNHGDLSSAEYFLQRAGDSPEADYARGILLIMQEKLDEALPLVKRGADAGIPEASDALKEIGRLKDYKGAVEIL